MKKRTRIVLVTVLALFACLAGAWQSIRPQDPLFRGQPESVWLANLKYNDDEQVKEWKEFGPEGTRFLADAYDRADRPADRLYRNAYRWCGTILPNGLMRVLPSPRMDMSRGTRACIVYVLHNLDKQDNIATPAMTRALDDDEIGVKLLAISYFSDEGNPKNAIDSLNAVDRETLLEKFLHGLNASNAAVRNNSIVALRRFPAYANRVIPALNQAMQDPISRVRIVASETIAQMAPDQFNQKAIQTVIQILKDPDDQIAYRAAQLLGEMHREPSLCVPALLESVQSPNQMVATTSAQALGHFTEQAETIVPVLLKIHEDPTSSVMKRVSKSSLKQLAPSRFADLK